MSVLQKLTEGIQQRDMQAEGQALLNKWEATGLLEGLDDSQKKQGMAVLLENQAKELLREASAMAAGDVEGFAAVAFPIVRRVFGGLIANDLISVQPMSLPSGLIFFLDFVHSDSRLGAKSGDSVYGGNVVARAITGGVQLGDQPDDDAGAGGFYNFGHGHATPSGSTTTTTAVTLLHGGGKTGADLLDNPDANAKAVLKAIRFDADILAHLADDANDQVTVGRIQQSVVADDLTNLDEGKLSAISFTDANADVITNSGRVVRRLTQLNSAGDLIVVFMGTNGSGLTAGNFAAGEITYPLLDSFGNPNSTLGAVAGQSPWGLEEPARAAGNPSALNIDASSGPGGAKASGAAGAMQSIPEIDIKVDSISVTAQTKKLKAKWTPELGQDLNAYHNLDAEVELTGILSEQIALEIDRELLSELVQGATAGTRYWSRAPGLFVNSSGEELGAAAAAPDFTGTVSEWYETLIETINDVSAQIHRKTLRGGANFVVCSPEVANILEFTSGFRASVTADQDRGTIGAVKAGSLSKKFDVYVDPYFLRNVLLVGRKGSSFLESGYVYAPYVPLQVTPTIFGTEDFVPRKGVMTRYAKKMVRPDMYGLVVVRGLLGEEGSK